MRMLPFEISSLIRLDHVLAAPRHQLAQLLDEVPRGQGTGVASGGQGTGVASRGQGTGVALQC
jgi:hypothetical protein